MSIRDLAQHVQAHGRGEDTVLIHMTPHEVEGLQRLAVHHGGSLTINPHTGLPEAGFLSTILPIVAGAALAPFTGGLSAALMVGAGAGLYQGIKSGSATKGLLSGLTAGLGAFGGAGLGSGLAKLGAAGAAEGVGAQAARSATSAVPNTAFQTGNSFLNPQAVSAASNTGQQVAQQALTPANFAQNFANMGRGIPAAAQNPGAYMDAMGGGMNTAKYAGAALAPAFMDQNRGGVPINGGGPSNLAHMSNDFMQRPMYSGTPNITRQFSGGGLASLGSYSDGGNVTVGPGDGMSDQIPATVGGAQRAALSPDEFVVPADAVSHIGNGSSEAGAQKLYAMLDRIRQARTGTAQQAPQINSEAMMPA
jgi:hypothetical protein